MNLHLDRAYSLSPRVAIRSERFGGLVYRYDTCKLYFLHSPMLVELLTGLDGSQPLDEALEVFVASRGLGPGDREALEMVLAQLEKMGILCEV